MAKTTSSRASRTLGSAVSRVLLIIVACCVPATSNPAQDGTSSLLKLDPYDQLTLDAANDNAVIKVAPIRFPGGKPPASPKSSDKLTVQLLETGRDYEVAWRHIVKLERFEDLLLSELKKLTADGNLDEAYEYLVHLRTNYPRTVGLDDVHHSYLYQSAGSAFKQGKFAEALGLLEELHRHSPRYQPSADGPTIVQVLGSAADKLIDQYVGKGDYRSARALLERLTKKYSAADLPFAVKWRTQLSDEAAIHREAARAALDAENFTSAYDAYSRMMEVWPQVEGGAELAAQMAENYPLVRVGVLSPALQHDSRSLFDPAARRTGRLLQRSLFEYQGMGPEGGVYQCPFGETEISDDGRELIFRLRPSDDRSASPGDSEASPLDGYRLSRFLLPSNAPLASAAELALRRLIRSVEVIDVWQLGVAFRRQHVLPQAVLQGVLDREGVDLELSGRFSLLSSSENQSRYVSAQGRRKPGQIAEIVERAYDDPQRAVLALQRREIDVLEKLFPGDIDELKQDRSISVATYGVPTTHLIVVRQQSPYLANRTFRRSLVYGSDRETILRQTLLRGNSLPGYRVVSAPFPAPTGSGQGGAYGYDQRILPRPFDPRLALTLRVLGQREVKAIYDQREMKLPPLEQLTLAHPADETARIACRALAAQWKAIGVIVKLVELPPGQFIDADQKHDLLYVEACLPEPLVDAGRLLGTGGLAATDSNFIQLCLRQIDSSSNWQQARGHFQELHRLLHEDVTLIPLWQTYDHFAFRNGIQGIGQSPVTLYQNIEQWRLSPQAVGN